MPSMGGTRTCSWRGWSETTLPAPPLVYLIERWSRVTGKIKGTVSLPVAARAHKTFHPRMVAGWSSVPTGILAVDPHRMRDKRSTVWDLATAKPLREFESDFTAEAFFPDGRRIIGMTGSDIVVRDVTTGGVTKRWPMPDGLVSVLGNLRNTPAPRRRPR